MTQVLLLGGTHDAQILATRLHEAGVAATYSYAGVTQSRRQPALPTRVGGFGGVAGLVQYLREHRITHVVDATHPFAAQMSANAVAACHEIGLPLLAMERPAWQAQPGDRWSHVPDMAAAAAALPPTPHRVFLAIGRKQLAAFASHTAHRYLVRVVDAPETPLQLAHCDVVVARGPFAVADELALLRHHAIEMVVSKNAGGPDTQAKLDAARALQLPVILVERPLLPARLRCETPQQAMDWLHTTAGAGLAHAPPAVP